MFLQDKEKKGMTEIKPLPSSKQYKIKNIKL